VKYKYEFDPAWDETPWERMAAFIDMGRHPTKRNIVSAVADDKRLLQPVREAAHLLLDPGPGRPVKGRSKRDVLAAVADDERIPGAVRQYVRWLLDPATEKRGRPVLNSKSYEARARQDAIVLVEAVHELKRLMQAAGDRERVSLNQVFSHSVALGRKSPIWTMCRKLPASAQSLKEGYNAARRLIG
jgi:hypothetical protein